MNLPFRKWPLGLLLSLFMFLPFQDQAQQAPAQEYKFVQFLVKDLGSVEDSRAIDAFIRAQEGIYMSRTDSNTEICFVIFLASASFNEEIFSNWIADFGYHIDCFREGMHGKDKVYSREQLPCN